MLKHLNKTNQLNQIKQQGSITNKRLFHNNIIKQMQNKNIASKNTFSNSSTHCYRSVKYRVNEVNTRPITNVSHYKTTYPDRNQNQTQTWRKSISFSQCKNKGTLGVEEVENKINPQIKTSYMDTWTSLMKPVQKQNVEEDTNNKYRVSLPSIIQFDPSHFTSLDPLFIPFQHIEEGIAKLKQQLPQPKIQMAQIHHDMLNFKQKIMTDLEKTESYGLKEFQKLRRMLRVEKVYNQENRLRFRRQCDELFIEDEQFRLNFNGTKPRLDVLQSEIFSCKPFELSRNPELNDEFPQQYF